MYTGQVIFFSNHHVVIYVCDGVFYYFTCGRVREVYLIPDEQFHVLFPLSSKRCKYWVNIFAAMANFCGLKQYLLPSLAIAILMNCSRICGSTRIMTLNITKGEY